MVLWNFVDAGDGTCWGGRLKGNAATKGQQDGQGFSKVQIALHWVVAALILFNLLMADEMRHAWREVERGGIPVLNTVAWAHIIAGCLILALVAWRLILRFTRGVPAAPEDEGLALRMAGAARHPALYALMIGLPVSGLLVWYGGMSSLGEVHAELLKTGLWVVIGLHVVAAFYHHFILKDGLLNRMRKPAD